MDEIKKLPWKTVGAVAIGGIVLVKTVAFVIPYAIVAGVGYIGYKGYQKINK